MIRSITTEDVPALKMIIDATGLFPSDMLDNMLVLLGLDELVA